MCRLWVLTCLDEHLPVDDSLGICADLPVGEGDVHDVHLFLSSGKIVTDDTIRSAMLKINIKESH